jgi:hypothetical protein
MKLIVSNCSPEVISLEWEPTFISGVQHQLGRRKDLGQAKRARLIVHERLEVSVRVYGVPRANKKLSLSGGLANYPVPGTPISTLDSHRLH